MNNTNTRVKMNRTLASVIVALLLSGELVGAGFDRQTFLAAVKDHIKAQPELLQSASRSWQGIAVVTPVSDAFRQYLSNEPPGEAWQRDLMTIPALKVSPTEWKATFEIALAYLASAETRTPPPDLLANLEGPNPNNIQGYGRFRNFVKDLLPVMLDESKPCSFQGFYRDTPPEVQFANSICTDLKQTVHDARQEYAALHVPSVRPSETAVHPSEMAQARNVESQGTRSAPEQIAQTQAIEAAKRQVQEQAQQQKARTDTEAALAEAQPRFDRLNGEKETLTAALRGFEDMGPLPTVDPTVPPSRIGGGRGGGGRGGRGGESGSAIVVERMNAESAKIERQLPVLRDELTKRQKQASVYAKQILQESKASIPQVSQLSALIGESGTSPDGVLKAYQAAKKLEADLRALSAAKERAGKTIASAKTELGMATNTPDQETGTAAKTTAQTMNELSVKVQSIDPTNTAQIIALATRLQAQSNTLHRLTREKAVMSTATGKRVYEGCYAGAKRQGLIAGTQVRVFKDEETNKAAEMATNPGVPFCRCVAVDIAGDNNITDAAKFAIARDLETKDKEDNKQLALVAGKAMLACQMK